ncbi:hypothetical protein MOD22_18555 [Bacillus haynesii]|uniref:hypothetical protein n=1 Tax=Bacillus haynesii TaxID=1925021 RepID=UPI002282291F|nr:hypothetical protein [Bacillus haynesii]MCY8543669.1 hypothetical protein [Bacillus haynesii]
MKNDKQLFKETKEAADIIVSLSSKNDENLLAYLAKQDTSVLIQLKVYFSNPTFILPFYIKWTFVCSLIAAFITTIFSGQVPFMQTENYFLYVIAFLFFLSCLRLVIFLLISKKGLVQPILHFAKKAEYARIAGMIDFILEHKYNLTT